MPPFVLYFNKNNFISRLVFLTNKKAALQQLTDLLNQIGQPATKRDSKLLGHESSLLIIIIAFDNGNRRYWSSSFGIPPSDHVVFRTTVVSHWSMSSLERCRLSGQVKKKTEVKKRSLTKVDSCICGSGICQLARASSDRRCQIIIKILSLFRNRQIIWLRIRIKI